LHPIIFYRWQRRLDLRPTRCEWMTQGDSEGFVLRYLLGSLSIINLNNPVSDIDQGRTVDQPRVAKMRIISQITTAEAVISSWLMSNCLKFESAEVII